VDRSKLVTVGGLTNGIDLSRTFFQRGGFPNRWCEGQWEPGLISQDLRRQDSREHIALSCAGLASFAGYSAPRVHQNRDRFESLDHNFRSWFRAFVSSPNFSQPLQATTTMFHG
jgi:hypothetical protein